MASLCTASPLARTHADMPVSGSKSSAPTPPGAARITARADSAASAAAAAAAPALSVNGPPVTSVSGVDDQHSADNPLAEARAEPTTPVNAGAGPRDLELELEGEV